MDLAHASLGALAEELRTRRLSAVELLQFTLARVSRYDPIYGAYITVDEDRAMAAAARAHRHIARGGYRGGLHGIPVAVKDMFATSGLRTTAGSQILASWVPDRDAVAVAALRRAGAIILGKTHTTEFAVWATGGHPLYRLPRNPWDMACTPGGSSSGSAVAVAAGLAPAALGTDTGGSSRIPAALCGVVGYKPTRAAISTCGVIPLSWSHDHVGLIAGAVGDCRALLGALQPSSLASGDVVTPACLDGLRVGVLPCSAAEATDAVRAAIHSFRTHARQVGAQLDDVGRDWTSRAARISPTIQYPELAAFHASAYAERAGEYGPDVQEGLKIGRAVAAVDYVTAQRGAKCLQHDVDAALARHDVLVSPVVPFAAPRLGADRIELGGASHDINTMISQHTRPFNVTGHPAVTIPWDLDPDGLPIAVQLIGSRGEDARLLRIAELFEAVSPWDRRSTPALTCAGDREDGQPAMWCGHGAGARPEPTHPRACTAAGTLPYS